MAAVIKKREFCNFNNQDYDFTVEFNNGERTLSLNAQSLIELEIRENFIDWYTSGSIIIDNTFDHFERLPDFGNTPLAGEFEDIDYKYRGDGRDMLTIKIFPRIDSKADNSIEADYELKTEIWEIYIEAVIYDIEEIPTDDPQSKQKKFLFWDKEYHIMLEKNIEFTTANVGANKENTDIHNLSNIERSLKTGEALLELFKSVDELKEKVPENADDETWVAGSDRVKIMHTSPSNFKLIDDVDHIVDAHANSEADDYDLCFLRLNRRINKEPRMFSFESLTSYFKKAGSTEAGEYQLDRFVLMDLNESQNNVRIHKIPQTPPNAEKNIMTLTRSEINSYQFMEMSGIDSSELIQIFPIHSYNIDAAQFNIHFKENTPKKAKEYQQKNYVDKIGPKSTPRLQLNTWKKNGYNLTNIFGYGNKENRYTYGRNKILMSSLLNGAAISFSCKGQTSRQAGRFIAIEKVKYNDTDFDERIEGQYLTMEVLHNFNFKTQSYNNNIIATKLHRFSDNGGVTPEDETLLLDSSNE